MDCRASFFLPLSSSTPPLPPPPSPKPLALIRPLTRPLTRPLSPFLLNLQRLSTGGLYPGPLKIREGKKKNTHLGLVVLSYRGKRDTAVKCSPQPGLGYN